MIRQFARAKHNLSEVMTRALNEGPQRIRWRGRVVVMLSEAEFQRLSGKTTLKDYLLNGPDLGELDLTRDQTPMREIT